MRILATSLYYLLICSGSAFVFGAFGPIPALCVAVFALWARAKFGPLNGTKPAGSHGMIDGLVAIVSVFGNLAIIIASVIAFFRG